jgi:hypothetical protein
LERGFSFLALAFTRDMGFFSDRELRFSFAKPLLQKGGPESGKILADPFTTI